MPSSSSFLSICGELSEFFAVQEQPGVQDGQFIKAIAVRRDGQWNLLLRAAKGQRAEPRRATRLDFAVMLASVRLVDLLLNVGRIDVREISAKFRTRKQRLHDPERSQFRRMIGIDEIRAVIVDRRASEVEK